jgi:hypothetical protein
VSRPRKLKVKSNAERQQEKRQRKQLGLHLRCKVTRYSSGTARYMTPEIRGKMISQSTKLVPIWPKKDAHRFAGQLRGMSAGQAFDRVIVKNNDFRYGDLWGHWSTFWCWCPDLFLIKLKYQFQGGKVATRFEYEILPRPVWQWVHPNFKQLPIDIGHNPTADEHGQRWERLGWKRPGFKFRGGHKSRWRKRPRKDSHAEYYWIEREHIRKFLCNGRKSWQQLSDESSDVDVPESIIGFEGMREAPSENSGPLREIGVTNRASLNWIPGEPPQLVTPKQIAKEKAGFEQKAQWLRAKALKKLKRKDKRKGPYIAERYWDCGPYPPPRRVRASIAPRELKLAA